MDNAQTLLDNLDKIHTTKMGIDRIKRNLGLETQDVVLYCLDIIKDKDCKITKSGKNWYAQGRGCIITVNASSYTIITAHKT